MLVRSLIVALAALGCGGDAPTGADAGASCEHPFGPICYAVEPLAHGARPEQVTIADMDGDDDPDLVVGANDRVTVYTNQAGVFVAEPAVATPTGVTSLDTGDVDGDGDQDVVIGVTVEIESYIVTLTNDGSGTLSAGEPVFLDSPASLVLLADMDGDELLDLVIAGIVYGHGFSILVALGDGAGNFAEPAVFSLGAMTRPVAMIAVDLDGDDDLDVATANLLSRNVIVLENDGLGALSTQRAYALSGQGAHAIGAMDLVGDSAPDLIVASKASDANLSILVNDGAGDFSLSIELPSTSAPRALVVGDADGNGAVEIAVVDDIYNLVAFRSLSEPAITATIPVGQFPIDLAGADFNGDGVLDYVTVNLASQDLSLIMSRDPVDQDNPASR